MDEDLIEENPINFNDLILRHRYPILILLFGLILAGLGAIYYKGVPTLGQTKVEVLPAVTENQKEDLVVEVGGAVEKPGVYKLSSGSRVEDAIVVAGGFSENADRVWVEKSLNRAAKISDGQKIYIPDRRSEASTAKNSGGYQSGSSVLGGQGSGLTNINSASLSELDKLPGIGPVYGQNIIDHRPYSNVEELLSKGVLKKNVYEKVKDKITVY